VDSSGVFRIERCDACSSEDLTDSQAAELAYKMACSNGRLREAATIILANLIDADDYGPDDTGGADCDDWPRDEDGDLWYPDVWELKEALNDLSQIEPNKGEEKDD